MLFCFSFAFLMIKIAESGFETGSVGLLETQLFFFFFFFFTPNLLTYYQIESVYYMFYCILVIASICTVLYLYL